MRLFSELKGEEGKDNFFHIMLMFAWFIFLGYLFINRLPIGGGM